MGGSRHVAEILAAPRLAVGGHGICGNYSTVRIRRMTGRSLRVSSRLVFFLCGLVSLVTAVPFALLRGVGLPYQSEWVVFVAALGVTGLLAITLAVMRISWIARLCKTEHDDVRIYSSPAKLASAFALVAYVMAVFAHFVPQAWNLNPQVMFALCPLYVVRMTFDPSASMVLFLLAPMNSATYGSLGAVLGFVWLAIRSRPEHKTRSAG